MMENNEIKLNTGLAAHVIKSLNRNINIPPHTKMSNGCYSPCFNKRELESITILELVNPVSTDYIGISNLTNLKRLIIKTLGNNNYKSVKNTASINDENMKEIETISSLEELRIINQSNLKNIDLSNLSNLKIIKITRNVNLTNLVGLDKLKKLYILVCYGNNSLNMMNNLNNIINNNIKKLMLDVQMYPDAIGYNYGEFNNISLDILKKLYSNCTWCEAYDENNTIYLTTSQMQLLHEEATKIYKEIYKNDMGIKDYTICVDEYIAKNIFYDYEALEFDDKKHVISGRHYGPENGVNSAFNALIFKSCCCDGYTRSMQYLLRLMKINTRNITCIGTSSFEGYNKFSSELPESGQHSIICVNDLNNLYIDSCWNAYLYQKTSGGVKQKWTLLTKNEISKDHTLSFEERSISNEHMKQSRRDIESILNKYLTENKVRER